MLKIKLFFIAFFVSSLNGYNLRDIEGLEITKNRPEHFGLTDAEDQFKNLDCQHVDECEDSKAEEKEIRCASDGNDYKGKCKMMREACEDKFLHYRHNGECTAREKCIGHHETGMRKMNEGKHFVPVCNEEGYIPLQCHKFSGHCWCSDVKGVPIPGTVTMRDTPNCPNHTGTSSQHLPSGRSSVSSRRKGTDVSFSNSSSKVLLLHPFATSIPFPLLTPNTSDLDIWWKVNSEGKNTKTKKRKSKIVRGCAAKQRRLFNKNMLEELKTEFVRSVSPPMPTTESDLERDSLTWKFLELDKRKDGYLRKKEYIKMAKLVHEVIQPKTCAKKFPKMCDVNADKKISRKEWIDCLLSDSISKSLKGGRKDRNRKGGRKKKTKLGRGKKSKLRPCEYEQRQVNETIESGNENLYSPKCSKSGTYNQIQCYGTLIERYCFCVDVYTGDMVENSWRMNGKPKICPVSWPKCPPPKKSIKFLQELIQYFGEYIQSNIKRRFSSYSEKQIIERIFDVFDLDNNGYLQKAEKRRLKNLLKGRRSLWRCGRKIHKICDINSDTKITQEELKYCIDTKIGASEKNSVVTSDVRRKGENPFIEYFKPEKETKN